MALLHDSPPTFRSSGINSRRTSQAAATILVGLEDLSAELSRSAISLGVCCVSLLVLTGASEAYNIAVALEDADMPSSAGESRLAPYLFPLCM